MFILMFSCPFLGRKENLMHGDDELDGGAAGDDVYTEAVHEGWLSRIGNAIKGVVFGLGLILGVCILLFWNEGRTVKRFKALQEGRGAVISVPAESVLAENNGKLVHVSGMAVSTETLTDPNLDVQMTALKLERQVEMFQWEEETSTKEEKKLGGGVKTVTTYSYKKAWSGALIDSSGFRKSQEHRNPESFPVKGGTVYAAHATLGAFALNRGQLDRINDWRENYLEGIEPKSMGGRNVQVEDGKIYVGNDPSVPSVGDVRISYRYVPDTPVTVVARQIQGTFEPYVTSTGSVDLLSMGTVSSDTLFGQAEETNAIVKWGLRVLGLVLLIVGLQMVLNPLVVIGDVVPLIGGIISLGVGLVSVVLGLAIGLIVIAVAWFVYRPILSMILIGIAVAGLVTLKMRFPKKVSESNVVNA